MERRGTLRVKKRQNPQGFTGDWRQEMKVTEEPMKIPHSLVLSPWRTRFGSRC